MSLRLALNVRYDGTAYRGWTDVRDSALRPTLSKVLFKGDLDSLPLVEAASRTDAGVHALGQVCSVALGGDAKDASPIARAADMLDVKQLAYSLNQLLPADIAIRRAALVDDAFDVRSNIGKTYCYRLSTGAMCRDPLTRLYEWHVPPRRGQSQWDAARVASLATRVCGTHAFTAFGNTPRGAERGLDIDPICTLQEVSLRHHHDSADATLVDGGSALAVPAGGEDGDAWTFTVRGDRFLYKMVRNLVGALVKVGFGELEEDEVLEALETGEFAKRPASLPLTAPACGLVLRDVAYLDDPFAASS